MNRIKITILDPCGGGVRAYIVGVHTLYERVGALYTPPNGDACGIITKIELVMDASDSATVDMTAGS